MGAAIGIYRDGFQVSTKICQDVISSWSEILNLAGHKKQNQIFILNKTSNEWMEQNTFLRILPK